MAESNAAPRAGRDGTGRGTRGTREDADGVPPAVVADGPSASGGTSASGGPIPGAGTAGTAAPASGEADAVAGGDARAPEDAAARAGRAAGAGRGRVAGAGGSPALAAYVAFAAFGAFWGVWGASVPRVRLQAGVTDGQLGLALLFVGAGALPAMPLAGRAVDRWGPRAAAGIIVLLGFVGTALALTAHNMTALCAGLAVAGASSGAADVAMNAVAGRAEVLAARPVIARAHGTFSAAVVASGLATGLAAAGSLPLAVPFAVVTVLATGAGAAMLRALPRRVPAAPVPRGTADPVAGSGRSRLLPLLLVGILGAVAFANENAQQSWSAVYARDELHTGTGLAAVAPAVFAATVSLTRFCLGAARSAPPRALLLTGALTAAAGSLTIAAAPALPVAACGLVLSGAGTAVLFPTLVALVSRNVEESRRGRATSVVGTVAYLGFLLGPVYIGTWSGVAGLRGAMIADACLAGVLFLLTAPLLRLTGYHLTPGKRTVCDGTSDEGVAG
jgi:MFS family permease